MPAAQSTNAFQSERRIAPRLQPAFRTICRLNAIEGSNAPAIGLVWNISETGLSMLMAKPPASGADLTGALVAEEGGAELPVRLHVVHIRHSSTGDYILGARFGHRLDPLAIESFLANPNTPSNRQEPLTQSG